jgi:hypothetical protein
MFLERPISWNFYENPLTVIVFKLKSGNNDYEFQMLENDLSAVNLPVPLEKEITQQ